MFAPALSTSSAAAGDEMPPPIVKGTVTASATLRTTSRSVLRPSMVAVMSSIASSSAPAVQYARQHSTGSPASLMFTKLTPLTTRPLIMSRHGMMVSLRSISFFLFLRILSASPAVTAGGANG